MLSALITSGADEAPQLIETLITGLREAPDSQARAAVCTAFEQAIADRGHDLTTLKDLFLNITNAAVGRMGWRMAARVPGVGSAAAAAHVAQALYHGSWNEIVRTLPTLVALLPSLRESDTMESLVRLLPLALRTQLEALQQWLQQSDDDLLPDLDIQEVGGAIAAAVLLWHLQSRLPSATGQLQGLARFIADLPKHWQQVVSLGGLGAKLFAAPETTALALRDETVEIGVRDLNHAALREWRARMKVYVADCNREFQPGKAPCVAPDAGSTAQSRWNNHVPGFDRPALSALAEPQQRSAPTDIQGFAAPASLATAGPISAPPILDLDAAASPAARPEAAGVAGWMGWLASSAATLASSITTLGQFQRVAQEDAGIEMMELGGAADARRAVDPSSTALLGDVDDSDTAPGGFATSLFAGVGQGLRKHPLRAAATAVVGSAAVAAGKLIYDRWSSDAPPPTTLELADQLANGVVSVDGVWGTGVDVLLGTPELPGNARVRRSVSATDGPGTTSHEDSALGITDEQGDQLLADASVTEDLRSMQVWALAVAKDIATVEGWQWLSRLPASEQELVVNQLHVLRELEPALAALASMPQTALDEALKAAGYNAGGANLRVNLGTTVVAGVTVAQDMPLLEYCLLRAGEIPPGLRISRDGQPLSAEQEELLKGFIHSNGCQQLQRQVEQRSEALRPPLLKALRARMVVDAVKAKAQGALGSGGNTPLRGADIVLGYLQGAQDVESAALTYQDVLADGTRVSFVVPNYLVLRSASADDALNGQVVLYRPDLAQFQTFGDEAAFRQFLDANRARSELYVVNGAVNPTIASDVIAAAPPAQRAQVQEQVRAWEKRQTYHQAGKRGPESWNAGDSFVLDFQPVSSAGHALTDWADTRLDFAQRQVQQELDSNRLRWSAVGLANAAADEAHARYLREDMQTLQDHARPEVSHDLVKALKLAGVTVDADNFNPDHIQLSVNGVRMSLTDFAVSGWQQHGLPRPVLPDNLADLPGIEGGLPNQRHDSGPWPSSEDLWATDITAYTADGAVDNAFTRQLLDEDARRAICVVLDDLADSNRLATAYVTHLKDLAHQTTNGLHTTVADQIRVHTLWMIEQAQAQGSLNPADYAALKAAHAQLEPTHTRASSLQVAALKDHPVNGVWALKANGRTFTFLVGTEAGDQLMDEAALRNWLQRPEAEAYVKARTAQRYHDDLETVFRSKRAARGLPLTFVATRGPLQAAKSFIDARLADVDEMTVSQLERFTEAMTIFASVAAAVSCTIASGGTAVALCVSSTLALVADGIRRGMDALERGDTDRAITEFGSGIADALDAVGITAIPMAMFQLGRRGLSSVSEAVDALAHWRRQAAAFTDEGQVNPAFVSSSQSLREVGLPMLKQQFGPNTLYGQGGNQYVRQGQDFVRVHRDENDNVLRLHMSDNAEQAGPPVQLREGQLQRMEKRPAGLGTTSPKTVEKPDWISKVPEAGTLPAEKIDEIEAVFGVRAPGMKPSADMHEVIRDLNMQERLKMIIDDPSTLGLPGDEAMIMRAWADSPKLGNGKSVETYSQELGEWNRGARFGKGPVGMMVEVPEARQLPSLEALVDAADQVALEQRLNLPAGSERSVLIKAVREEIVRTIAANKEQSLLSWKRWLTVQHRLPTAADNLSKHYPELTKAEAESLTDGDTQLSKLAQSWVFPGSTSAKVADVLAQRSRRQQRQSVLSGRIRSLSQAQELRGHLQQSVPDRNWRVTEDATGKGYVLSFGSADGKENARSITFTADGNVRRPVEGGGEEVVSWEEAIFDELTPSERRALGSPAALRAAVVEHMKRTPLVATTSACALPVKGNRVKRGTDCSPPSAITLSADDVNQRDDLTRVLDGVHRRMTHEHD
ncbi:hypothetical protein [Stenotrophomonas oahuensis]|uniref:Uncharacterized protein n=1 Tax=Stenotrophomonas oahuensis TaxID=3003271 RepID=A0ABY9YST2_9GAMM|nr:hypothetical protein [Stenotrophomonas sp. A5586]WNH53989.1 hypothetical protein PDM29_06815 [Stenotrophomonas sp. A5586]